ELKTPLVSICNASALLYELFKEELSDKAKDLVKIIMKGGERLEELVQNLIDVSRIESGKLNLNLKDVDITKIIKECIEDLYFQLKTREICIEFNKNKSVILAVDSIRFKQVIMNLLINAIKYTPPGGSISILLDKNDKNLEIKIIDDGIGFTSEEKKLIFKKFGKIERYGQGVDVISDGSGLGLYISKEIVNAHHGIIRVESEGRNKGSIFIISLPWI
ncbi:MAG: sensor histidine kinase, partial [Candidatus Hermodarchaeota archaeon]